MNKNRIKQNIPNYFSIIRLSLELSKTRTLEISLYWRPSAEVLPSFSY